MKVENKAEFSWHAEFKDTDELSVHIKLSIILWLVD